MRRGCTFISFHLQIKLINILFKVKLFTETGQIGVIGVRVSVITVLEQEHGTELDLAPTQHPLATEGSVVKCIYEGSRTCK